MGLTIILCAGEKHTNAFYPIGLLCFGPERPRSRGAANQCDELAPSHAVLTPPSL
jgi:hypothetical protein